MSEFEVPGRPPVGAHNEIPAAMVLAMVFGIGVAIAWGLAALVLIWLVTGSGGWGVEWMFTCLFAVVAGVIGVIGCLRRWVWVRWAALAQAIAVSVTLFGLMGVAPFVPWAVGLFIAYAGLQFLPSSHRWYHPLPRPLHPTSEAVTGLNS
ncbi:hypothetical protein [Microbacterium galbinum]|uniref:Uncharacterized protein n=1 Tax=Microbacterium galbinum TaxID=2851646 RepID=A0ABY4IN72_9MICO|nr:hypothetical protein [Microbacterium galbinum]UPL13705.1 hypothetical protein KV396_04145 [Microbacterium galbinum]